MRIRYFSCLAILLFAGIAFSQHSRKESSAAGIQCTYESQSVDPEKYALHGITCQHCRPIGDWEDVDMQYCQSEAKRKSVRSTKPKKTTVRICTKSSNGLSYSLGAIFYDGATDCSRCVDRTPPDDWFGLDTKAFCANSTAQAETQARQ